MGDDYKIQAFSIILQANMYVKGYNSETKWMHFLIEDYELLKKYNGNEKGSNSIKKNLIGNTSTLSIF